MNKQLVTLLLAMSSSISIAQDSSFRPTVHCTSTTFAATKVSPNGPDIKVGASEEEIWIMRRGSSLFVQINPQQYKSLEAKLKRQLQQPDRYKVIGETGEGLTAIHIASLATTQQTLILRTDQKRAIWVETAFSFLQPQSEPVSDTYPLTCKKVEY